MRHQKNVILILILSVMSIPSHAQFNNLRNLDFNWKTDTTIHSVDLSEISLVLPKGTFPKIDFPSFLDKKEANDD